MTRPLVHDSRIRAQILREAIMQTGGPASPAIAAVRNRVDRRVPHFPWSHRWFDEIAAAKAALRLMAGGDENTGDEAAADGRPAVHEPAPPSPYCDPAELRRAHEFVLRLADGSIERALDALAFLESFGSLDGLRQSIERWGELLQAVDGNTATAERVLDVLDGRRSADENPAAPEYEQRHAA